MIASYVLTILFFFLAIACDNQQHQPIESNVLTQSPRKQIRCDTTVVNVQLPVLIWKKQFVNDELASSLKPIVGDGVAIFSNSHTLNSKDRLVAFDCESGVQKWIWESPPDIYFHLSSSSLAYTMNNSLSLAANGHFHNIDMSSGHTNFTINVSSRSRSAPVYGSGNLVFMIFDKKRGYFDEQFVAEVDLINQSWRKIYTSSKVGEFHTSLKLGYPIKHNHKNYVLISNNLSTSGPPVVYRFVILLVDLETTAIAWETVVESHGTIFNTPILYKGSVFVANSSIYRLDMDTGNIIWERAIEGGVGFAGMIMADGKLVVGTEGIKPMHHAFDPDTGDLIWSTSTSGTSSTMEYHNCVIYFTGGGDGKLHALNANTGEHLYILTSPDYAQNSNLFFGTSLTVDKTTNRLYTHNWYNAMCYQLPEY